MFIILLYFIFKLPHIYHAYSAGATGYPTTSLSLVGSSIYFFICTLFSCAQYTTPTPLHSHSQHQSIVMHPAPIQHMHRFRRPTHIKTTDPFKTTPASFVHVHVDAFQTAASGHFNRTTPSTSCHSSGVRTARTVGFPFHPIRQG